MPKAKSTMVQQAVLALWGNWIKRLVTLAVGIGAISTAIVTGSNAWTKVEPYTFVTAGYVRDYSMETVRPVKVAQEQHSVAIDFLILKDERQALKDAKAELATNPNSSTIRNVIEQLERSIAARQERLHKAGSR